MPCLRRFPPPWSIEELEARFVGPAPFYYFWCQFSAPSIRRELNMTALQGWIVIGLLVLIMLGVVGLGAEIKALPYLWRASAEEIK
jgi:hypothetical protein